jgi:SH3 domain-containing YSC84-like protein 1
MKLILSLTTLLVLGLVAPAVAADKLELEKRIAKLAEKFEAMQSKPGRQVPADVLEKAKGIVLLDRTKAGFIFAYQGGSGVAMLRDAKTGAWSAPSFLRADEASLGFQIGGQKSFFVILLMNENAIRMLTDGNVSFGGEASGTAGNTTDGVESTIDSTEQLTVVYSDKSGLYGGAAVKGGALKPDTDANLAYHGEFLTSKEILQEGKGKAGAAASNLAARIEKYRKQELSK